MALLSTKNISYFFLTFAYNDMYFALRLQSGQRQESFPSRIRTHCRKEKEQTSLQILQCPVIKLHPTYFKKLNKQRKQYVQYGKRTT